MNTTRPKGMQLYGGFLTSWRNAFGREIGPISASTHIAVPDLEAAEAGVRRLSTVDWRKLIQHYKAKVPEGLCRECGCCDDSACVGGCSWAGPSLCSSCDAIQQSFKARVTRLLDMLAKPCLCKKCRKPIYFLTTKNRRSIPISESGLVHFIDCPYAGEFRRENFKRNCQGEK